MASAAGAAQYPMRHPVMAYALETPLIITTRSFYLLEEAHVATVDGAAFCAPGYIRLSYATSDDNIRESMRRIATALAKLQ